MLYPKGNILSYYALQRTRTGHPATDCEQIGYTSCQRKYGTREAHNFDSKSGTGSVHGCKLPARPLASVSIKPHLKPERDYNLLSGRYVQRPLMFYNKI